MTSACALVFAEFDCLVCACCGVHYSYHAKPLPHPALHECAVAAIVRTDAQPKMIAPQHSIAAPQGAAMAADD